MNHRSNAPRASASNATQMLRTTLRDTRILPGRTALCCAIVAILAAGYAHAATDNAVDGAADLKAANTQSLEEVKVTATKRSTSLQKTPLAVTAIGEFFRPQQGARALVLHVARRG